ncbi:MAG: hypothetical protein M3P93_07305, partial [Actinomycetota bacterium]|nr:hypothetical protein [Actinomycetota bacterium]
MPSASRSEQRSEQPAEVVQSFSGDSLEEAMAAAVDALGPDLVVRRARKVRSGVRGLMGRERYQVLALPDPLADPEELLPPGLDGVDDAGSHVGGHVGGPLGSQVGSRVSGSGDGDAVGGALDALLD